MDKLLLCDTCVIIDYINGNSTLLSDLKERHFILFVNSVIEMELLQGAHDKEELKKIGQKLNTFRRLEISQDILYIATTLIRKYSLSHNMQLPDSVIAATASVYDVPLLTYNTRDFKYIPDVKILKPSQVD
ncbi:MAG: type II toxin-antitoxin system VapC family toxin [Deltaproteobacteria bacterium]|nr:MAG: type II toxin-antitoxin system VapC family toxin [Deltaproteobacteria bacterium]